MEPSFLKRFVLFRYVAICFLLVYASQLVTAQKCEVVGEMPSCFCVEGYLLTDNTCSPKDPHWKLVYASKNQVVTIASPGMTRSNLTDGNVTSVTSDARNQIVYLTKRGAVYKTSSNGGKLDVVVNAGISNPSGIAFDWITGNIYFTDSQSIVVCSQNPTRCVVVIKDNAGPFGIALHPNSGIMFWITPGNNTKRHIIMKSGMDGSTPAPIISTEYLWPNSVTVDEANSRIYWSTQFSGDHIQSSRFDGSDRQRYKLSGNTLATNIFILEDRIFWSDVTTETIRSANKFTGKEETIILSNCSSQALSLMHVAMQPKLRVNPCEDLKGDITKNIMIL